MRVAESAKALPTTMSAAFERAGISKSDMRAFAAAQEFIEAGGTLERWTAIYRQAAQKLSDGGRSLHAAQFQIASVRQQNGEGIGRSIDASHQSLADSSPTARAGPDQEVVDTQEDNVQPVREPSASQRSASVRVANALAITVLDTYRIRDGRSIGDVRFGEVDRLRLEDIRHASVWRQIQLAHPNTPHDMKLRDVIKAEELQRFVQRGAEVADAS